MAFDRHIILVNKDSLMVVNDFPAVMAIQEIASGKVIALEDTSPKELNVGPCASCQVLIHLRLTGDSLVREK
jgi:hypothetical protein